MEPSRRNRPLLRLLAALLFLNLWISPKSSAQTPLRFEISVPESLRSEPITGRVYVMFSPNDPRSPYLQVGRTGIPFFGTDVESLPPGTVAVVDEDDLGTPVANLSDIPPGDYFIQAFVSIYSKFQRADGHVVWMHDDQWEGQRWNRSPGNLYSVPQRVTIDPTAGGVFRLEANRVIPPVEIPDDTEWVRHLRFQSPTLTEFWGRPIYLGATVLLPLDYDQNTMYYPVVYEQDHFSLDAPMGFAPGGRLYDAWTADDFPRMIVVTFQHPTPYFDDSYAVNSANVGPYGDAIIDELIPEIEQRFRVITEPWARILTGGSTGGWEALALQIFHPDFFGGTWAYCPDPVDFHDVEGINIYEDTNAYYKQQGGRRVPTPNTRETNGEIRLTSEQRNHFELVSGTKGRSGEQLDAWSAVYGPVGEEGYFKPLFDKFTGEIDPDVAEYWRENYDLRYYLEQNWTEVGRKLIDKLHVYTGTMDNFYLNNSTKMLEEWMATTTDPHYEGYFEYGIGAGHCWAGTATSWERLQEMADYVIDKKPTSTPAPWY